VILLRVRRGNYIRDDCSRRAKKSNLMKYLSEILFIVTTLINASRSSLTWIFKDDRHWSSDGKLHISFGEARVSPDSISVSFTLFEGLKILFRYEE